jgi:hypothetical protein
MLVKGKEYKPSMTKFLNSFSLEAKGFGKDKIEYLEKLFHEFLDYIITTNDKIFYSKGGRFNISIYESVFYASCLEAYKTKTLDIKKIALSNIEQLKNDKEFYDATQVRTTQTTNVKTRLKKAREILLR